MALGDFTYRLKALAGDSTPHDELGVTGDLTGGTPTLVDDGSDKAWQFSAAAVATGPSVAFSGDGEGITIAVRLRITTAGGPYAVYAGYMASASTSHGVSLIRNTSTALKGRYRAVTIHDTGDFTHGTSFVTYVLRMLCSSTSVSDYVQVWHSSGSGDSGTPDLTSAGFNAGTTVTDIFVAGGGTIEISDLVMWDAPLSGTDCVSLAMSGIRATLDGGGPSSSIPAIFNHYNRLRRA